MALLANKRLPVIQTDYGDPVPGLLQGPQAIDYVPTG